MDGFDGTKDYKSKLGLRQTEKAIKMVKDIFEKNLAKRLNLERVSAPLFLTRSSGLNDDLNGTERAVSFDIRAIPSSDCVIVHSLAKWKRVALKKYGFDVGEGIYTDMNAIRRDDKMDNIHSIYVDQWDWEKVIDKSNRNVNFLKETVQKIVDSIVDTCECVKKDFPELTTELERKVTFITTQELMDIYPNLTEKERENAIVKEYKTVFIMQVGKILSNGAVHDGRAPDYDDWDLNGDIMFYNKALDNAIEISSMGIRVDDKSLLSQLKTLNLTNRLEFEYHKGIMNHTLPLTVGGGIGQSRLCLLILQKLHIGEVHSSIWDDETHAIAEKNNINIL